MFPEIQAANARTCIFSNYDYNTMTAWSLFARVVASIALAGGGLAQHDVQTSFFSSQLSSVGVVAV